MFSTKRIKKWRKFNLKNWFHLKNRNEFELILLIEFSFYFKPKKVVSHINFFSFLTQNIWLTFWGSCFLRRARINALKKRHPRYKVRQEWKLSFTFLHYRFVYEKGESQLNPKTFPRLRHCIIIIYSNVQMKFIMLY